MSRKARSPARLGSSRAFPHLVYIEPAESEFNAIVKRGGPLYFDAMAETGFEVTRIPVGDQETTFKVRSPWTFVFAPVPVRSAIGWIKSVTAGLPCSVIYDVHFPIMQMDQLIGADEGVRSVIDHRDEILANIRAACAVTVPQESWAADLVEVNDRVWWLPDILIDPAVDDLIPDDADESVFDDLQDRMETFETYGVRFAEVMQGTILGCRSHATPAEEAP